ncbi:MAG: SinI family restriction endonuclease, partial [Phormidium sp.]
MNTPDFINEFYFNYRHMIDENLNDVDTHKERILYILYFLDKYENLKAKGVKELKKNSPEYFKNVIGKYIASTSRKQVHKLSLNTTIEIGETIPDQIVKLILLEHENNNNQESVGQDNEEIVDKYIYGHRIAMSAENLLGRLLEAYIADKIEPYGWIWCSGEIVFATDFIKCSGEGKWICLQVKNADNSENSSSSQIRKEFKRRGYQDVTIEAWFRSVAQWKLDSLKKRISQNIGIKSVKPEILKEKIIEYKLNSNDFTEFETWLNVAKLFDIPIGKPHLDSSLKKIQQEIYSHLNIKNLNN